MNAWIFPGQGSQAVGMANGLQSEPARRTFALAGEVLGWDVRAVCADGPAEALDATEVAQPALLTASVAVASVLQANGLEPDVVAGHSLGEFAALVVARAVPFEDALQAVEVRGRAMAAAGRARPGGMAAVLGLSLAGVEEACANVSGTVVVANVNGPDQVVISGERDAVAAASDALRSAGARRVIPLAVSVAAHSPLVAGAAAELRAALASASIVPPAVPFVSCTNGRTLEDPAAIVEQLVAGVAARVRWLDAARALDRAGASSFIEVGPGRVLSSLVRRILPGATVLSAGDDDQAARAAGALRAGVSA
jgi:[acyl-carrier-protein] S-malonyltransferase